MDHVRRRKPREWITLAGGLLFVQATIAVFVIPYVFASQVLPSHDSGRAVAIVLTLAAFSLTPFALGVAVQGRVQWAWKPAVGYTLTAMILALVGGAVIDQALGSLFMWNFAAFIILMMGPVRLRFESPPGPLERADQRSRFRAQRTLAAQGEPRPGSVLKNWNPDKARGDS